MIVLNRIEDCYDGKTREIDHSGLRLACVHRIDVGETAAEIAESFRTDLASYTGGEMPYALILRRDGVWEQALRLYDYAPHARKWSSKAIGLGLVGDFRNHQAPDAQLIGLWNMLQIMRDMLGGVDKIVAHDELPGGSRDPNKACPGWNLQVSDLRWELYHDPGPRLRSVDARAELERLGVVF